SDITSAENFLNSQKNKDPKFRNTGLNDYRLDTLSPAIDIGSLEIINSSEINIMFDLNGNPRTADAGPDLGALEFVTESGKK
ncbi:MAG: choice-of-anchor Q domain-containing protein, partial [Bacteroidales bacterium]